MEYKLELFRSSDGIITFPVPIEHETVWLSQQQMAELFGKDRTVIAKHIKNAIEEGEINPKVVRCRIKYNTMKLLAIILMLSFQSGIEFIRRVA